DGDGQYEIILKWDPTNSLDSMYSGFTGPCIIDAYELDGTKLWRINMGPNIRAGAHDTQFMVYDFDMDGKAEMAVRTADGTIAGDGTVIGDPEANYAAESDGKNLTGPLFLTVFNGTDGTIIDTVDYDPQTTGVTADGVAWDITSWGDSEGNRSERYLAGVGYLDGERPSMVFCRGYYTGPKGDTGGRTVIVAYDLIDGKLVKKWRFDTMDYGNDKRYLGQGFHSMTFADVDYDACDELIYGSLAIDNDGTPLYSTELGTGDAQHVGDFDPSRPGLEVYSCYEDVESKYGYAMTDARTGEVLYGEFTGTDNGRGAADDIDPNHPGAEAWSAAGILTAADGEVLWTKYTMAANFFAWWDEDLGREIQDGIYISKWNHDTKTTDTIFTAEGVVAINDTKANPALTADILGDWREEVIYPLKDSSALRLYMTTDFTGYRLPTLMHDTQYRLHVAMQNNAYNQPTHVSYYLGYDMETVPVPQIYVNRNGAEVRNPDLAKKSWDIASLYTGVTIIIALDAPTAIVQGVPMRIDYYRENGTAMLDENERTLVPISFIPRAFNTDVAWDSDTKRQITIYTKEGKYISMNTDETVYEVGSYSDQSVFAPHAEAINIVNHTDYKEMDTAPILKDDNIYVPLRAISEELGYYVYWNSGLIFISDVEPHLNFNADSVEVIKKDIYAVPLPDIEEEKAIQGVDDKYYDNQLDVFMITASGNDGNHAVGAVDRDFTTRWSGIGPNTLTVDLGSEKTVTGVAIAMWKGNERNYPFQIEYSQNGFMWMTALPTTQNSGETDGFEEYMFEAPITARYIRYNGEGDTTPGKNYCHISEIAILGE
ncbi:MAG: discoidin domain-containing protein, partial [Oscillospiraceae bacterium]|nr:discoidin domain-containing protein [Oscillospiraceae bacterium]